MIKKFVTLEQLKTTANDILKKVKDKGYSTGGIVDSEMSSISENPVQNKVITDALSNKVDKVTGKGLSTNDYTTVEKNKLAGLSNYDDTAVNNNMVRAGTADANGQSRLFKTVNGTTTDLDPKCSLATKANQLKLNAASADSNTDRPILCAPAVNPTTTQVQDVYKASDLTFNASKDELKTGMFKGGINTLVDHEAHNNVNNWRKVCEFSTNGHSNASGQCALSATILVTDGKYTSPKKGDALLRIVTHKEIKSGALNNIINNFTMDFSTGTVVDNTLSYKDPSSFKLTYTTNGAEITYKLWYYVDRTYLATNFILLAANSAYDTKSIVSEVDLSMGTLSTDYMDDDGVAATGVVDCVLGVIANDIEGNAKTSTHATSADSANLAIQARQELATLDREYPLLLSSSNNIRDETANVDGTIQRANYIFANPSTGMLSAIKFSGVLEGTATDATKVDQVKTASNVNRPLLLSGAANTQGATTYVGTVQRANNIYANASTGAITATSFVGNLTGNAESATSISKSQNVLLDTSYLADNTLVIQGLFTNWKLIFIQGTWVKNQTTYTHEFVLPLNVLEVNTTFTIRLHTGNQVVFWKVDDNTIRQGTIYDASARKVFEEVLVVGIY